MPANTSNIQRANTIQYKHVLHPPAGARKPAGASKTPASGATTPVRQPSSPLVQWLEKNYSQQNLREGLSLTTEDLLKTESAIKYAEGAKPSSKAGAEFHCKHCGTLVKDARKVRDDIGEYMDGNLAKIKEIKQEIIRINAPLKEAKAKLEKAADEYSQCKINTDKALERLNGKKPKGKLAEYRQDLSQLKGQEAKINDKIKYLQSLGADALKKALKDIDSLLDIDNLKKELRGVKDGIALMAALKNELREVRNDIAAVKAKMDYVQADEKESEAGKRYRGLSQNYSNLKSNTNSQSLDQLERYLDLAEKHDDAILTRYNQAKKLLDRAKDLQDEAADILASIKPQKDMPSTSAKTKVKPTQSVEQLNEAKLKKMAPNDALEVRKLIEARKNCRKNIGAENASKKLIALINKQDGASNGEKMRAAAKEFAADIAYNLVVLGKGKYILSLQNKPEEQRKVLEDTCLADIAQAVVDDASKLSGINPLMVRKTLANPIIDALRYAGRQVNESESIALKHDIKLPSVSPR